MTDTTDTTAGSDTGSETADEFDRATVVLAELASLDDNTVAFLAGIAFVDGNDHGVCQALREAIAQEYSTGRAERRDKFRNACAVANTMVDHGSHMAQFAAISRMGDMRSTVVENGDDDTLLINDGDDLDVIVLAALRIRYRQAAHALLTYLEENADDKEYADDEDDQDSDEGAGENV